MKKLFSVVVTIMLALVIMVPTVNAARLTSDKTEMKVGEIVTITITANEEVEYMQFDLKFDNTKFQYVTDSAKSAFSATGSNLTEKDVVTVSAFDLNEGTAKEITLQFKAISKGEHVPFDVVGTIEIGKDGEAVENPEIEILKIEEGPYVDDDGNIITSLPKTGFMIMIPVVCAVVVIIAVFTVKARKATKTSKKANRYK